MKNIFTKINKKILIIGVILIATLIGGFFVYKYSKDIKKETETPIEQTITPDQSQNQPQVNVENPHIKTQPQLEPSTQTGFSVCVDKCGDGVCQPAGTICKDNLNCICAETKTDCPSDCK